MRAMPEFLRFSACGKPCATSGAISSSSNRLVTRSKNHQSNHYFIWVNCLSEFRALFPFCFVLYTGSIAFAQHVSLDTPLHSPHGEKLKLECQQCHTTQGWRPLRDRLEFKHSRT